MSGFTIIVSLLALIVASKERSAPLVSSFFKIILASTLVSSNALSSIFRTGSEKVIFKLVLKVTAVAPSEGEKTTIGAIASSTVKVIFSAGIGLLKRSSIVFALSAA